MARPARLLDAAHRLRRAFSRRSAPPSGVLLVAAGGLGDTVLFSLVAGRFAALARAGEAVTVLLRHDGAKTAFCLPPGITVETFDFGRFDKNLEYRWQTLERLYRANYRLVVTTDFLRHPYLDEAMIAAAAAPEAAAMLARAWPKYDAALFANRALYTRLFDSGDARRDKVVRWSDFANWLNGTTLEPPKVKLPAARLTAPAPSPDGRREIIVQPFSAVAAKQPDVGCYLALADALPAGMHMCITGIQADLDANPQFQKLLEKQNVEFDSSTFAEICARLQAAELVVSVDTALMHLAVALGAPTLCLASAAYVGEIVPYDPRIRPGNVAFLYQEMPCQGCLGACVHPLKDRRYPCVDALTPERVVAAVLDRF
jgi:ADP-heptose:LPS heptosyltransferase